MVVSLIGYFFYYNILTIQEDNFPPIEISSDTIISYCDGKDKNILKAMPIDIDYIEVLINDSNEWYKNLYQSVNNPRINKPFIDPDTKKAFDSTINMVTEDFKCSFKGKVRISGDYSDHVDLNSFKSSLDVVLTSGNILGVTEFKLFIPETKNDSNEIILNSILEHYGFVTPRVFNVKTKINNQEEETYIFHEKIRKELVEHNNFPEGPIFRVYEDFMFENRTKGNSLLIQEYSLLYAKLINTEWGSRNLSNLDNSLKALTLLNNGYKNNKGMYGFDYRNITNEYSRLFDYDALLIAANANHGLIIHNRKFYFNIFEQKFYPIYYDGLPDFYKPFEENLIFEEFELKKKMSYPFFSEIADSAKNILNDEKIDNEELRKLLLSKNVKIKNEDIELMMNNFYKNLNSITKLSVKEYDDYNNIDDYVDLDFNLLFFESDLSKLYECNYLKINSCNNIDLDLFNDESVFKNLLSLNSRNYDKNYVVYGYQDMPNYTSEVINLENSIYISGKNTSNINIDYETREINFNFNDDENYLIYGDGDFTNWNIILKNMKDNNNYIKTKLTGCLTIYGLTIDNLSIEAKNMFCEDAVNIVKSKGTINSVSIENSISDGLDMDFSNIKIIDIAISSSGNDCLDLSGGTYNIQKMKISSCNDKGISIGEKSIFNLDKLNIDNSNVGIAIKDSSDGFINYLTTKNVNLCIALYRKKAEFGPSSVKINELECQNENIYVQEGSNFEN